ncbi:MAG TPA: DNA topoisomerase III [Acholeplasmataceae bacterium]|jgi:DNA topoisomerase-3|nr:DNA topoisomerase III [Acholeplasmataceae bacterium]
MSRTVVLAEKPSVGREIARVLGCHNKDNGYLYNHKYIVTWALGHLVTLAVPEQYTDKWKEWKLETLPMIPERTKLVVIKETSKQYNVVNRLLNRPDVDELIIATDAGREGELVARWIIEKCRFRKPIKRLWISSLTDQAIKEGFKKIRPGNEFLNLHASAQARSIADWLVGLNVTRALTCKYNDSLSAGRVQTPTLAMIVQREEEINSFVPQSFYEIVLTVKGVPFTYINKNKETRIFSKEEAEEILNNSRNKKANVKDIKKTLKKEQPPLLYDLTELQRDANRFFSFSAKKTLDLVQDLYEKHKYLTYPRTDSKYLSTDIFQTIFERIKNGLFGEYVKVGEDLLKRPLKNNKRIFNNSKVTDHHAIIPTGEKVNINYLSSDQKKIYELVLKRFLAAFMDDYQYEETQILLNIGSYDYRTKGKIVIDSGFYSVFKAYQEENEEKAYLPRFTLNESLTIEKANLKSGLTTPPARYTEATLLSAMEHPGKFIDNEEMKVILEEACGIGTPATRAEIIERIFSAGYAELKGKTIYPTSKGIQLINLVPKHLKSPELTAKWEKELTLISQGKRKSEAFIKEMEEYTKRLVDSIKNSNESYRHDNLTRKKCPECDQNLLEVKNKRGKMLVCSNRSCRYRKQLAFFTNLRCPTCHKLLEKIPSSTDDYYVCVCGYKEKVSFYHEKQKNARGQMTKRDISKYMAKQNKEIPANLVFLEKLKELQDKEK